MSKKKKIAFQPLGDRVLVRRQEAEAQRGGILIPEDARSESQDATVVVLGTGTKDAEGNPIPFSVQVGDLVRIARYGGTDVTLDGEEFLVLREEDILFVHQKSES